MKRFFLSLTAALTLGLPALADAVTDRVLAALAAQGYEVLEMHDTWLGRVRVVAESDTIRREIVFNPGTGEILRDYALDLVALAAREAEDDRVRDAGRTTGDAVATTAAEELRADSESFADDFILPEAIVTTPEE
jgi:hypothetical protein